MELKVIEPRIDLSGQKFGRLTVLRFIEKKENRYFWLCKCDCGNEVIIRNDSLKSKNTQSCGCYSIERTVKRSIKHGMSGTPIYNTWKSMIDRCTKINYPGYKNYGAKGISICNKWLTFEGFYDDMGDRPPRKTLDRKENSRNYCKENCRWADPITQANNTSRNLFITYNNKTQTIAQWAKELNFNYYILKARLGKLHWSIEKSLTTEVMEAYSHARITCH